MPSIPESDLSGQLLDKIFGNGWELITPMAGLPADEAASTFVFPLLQAFNAVTLTVIVIMLMITFGQGVIGTAHEGTPLGKRFSSIWVPIRGAIGTSMLIPVLHLSVLQIVLLTCISWSITFANDIWDTGLNYLSTHLSFSTSAVTEDRAEIEDLTAGILENMIVQDYYDIKIEIPISGGTRYTIEERDDGHKIYFVFSPPDTEDIDAEDMGRIFLECDDPDSELCLARKTGIEDLINDLWSVSEGIVAINTPDFFAETPSPEDFNNAVNRYKDTVDASVAPYISGKKDALTEDVAQFITEAKLQGWISAGSWYWNMVHIQSKAADEMANCPEVLKYNERVLRPSISYGQIEEYLNAAKSYSRYSVVTVEGNPGSEMALLDIRGPGDAGKWLGEKIGNVFSDNILEYFVNKISEPEADLVTNLADIGHNIIFTSGAILSLAAAVEIAEEAIGRSDQGFAGKLLSWVPGVSTKAKILKGSLIGLLNILGKLLLLLALALYPLGFTLAFYLPAVPFLLWILSVLNWLILILESIVAAPLWAAAHAMPHGEGFAGDYGRQGYFLFLNILIRPSLMLAGLLMSIILLTGVGVFIGEGFKIFANGMNADCIRGIPTAIAMIFVFGGLSIMFAHKIFGLILHLPDHVMRWIGSQVAGLGENVDTDKIKTMFNSMSLNKKQIMKESLRK